MREIWKLAAGWPAYVISDRGRVRRTKQSCGAVAGRILKPWLRRGYEAVHLSCDGMCKYVAVHRLVYESFIGPIPKSFTINHIDGLKLNNRPSNLEPLTIAGNLRHAARTGLTLKGERNHASKLTDAVVRKARALYAADNVTFKELATRFRVSQMAMRLAIRGDSWKHI